MAFDLTQWRSEMRQIIADFARDPGGTLARAGVTSLYGFLLGSTMLPVAAAYATDPGSAIVALSGVVGGLGTNLVANLIQKKYDQATLIATAAQEAQSADLAPAYEAIAGQLEVIPLAGEALAQAGQAAALAQLREELRQLGKAGLLAGANISVEQSGGVNLGIGNPIGQIGDIVGGDKIGGDKVAGDKHVHFGVPRPAVTAADHLQRLIDEHTRRLRVLEVQAAQAGYNARPEVLTEIETIRAEIAQLRGLMGSHE